MNEDKLLGLCLIVVGPLFDIWRMVGQFRSFHFIFLSNFIKHGGSISSRVPLFKGPIRKVNIKRKNNFIDIIDFF